MAQGYGGPKDAHAVVTATVKTCQNCESSGAILACPQCREVVYCSAQCQRDHWREHKADCKKPREKWEIKLKPPPKKELHTVALKEGWHPLPATQGVWTAVSSVDVFRWNEVPATDERWTSLVGDTSQPRIVGRISVICPTMEKRHGFHAQLYLCYAMQTHPDKELILIQSGGAASDFLQDVAAGDSTVKYVHLSEPLSVGAMRNLAIRDHASGSLIAHFDDDDVYFPAYLATMAKRLEANKAAIAAFKSWAVVDIESGHSGIFDRSLARPSEEEVRALGDAAGFSMMYTTAAWLSAPFADLSIREDACFLEAARNLNLPIELVDGAGRGLICLKLQHGGNACRAVCHKAYPKPETLQTSLARLETMFQRISQSQMSMLHLGLARCSWATGFPQGAAPNSGMHIYSCEEAYAQWRASCSDEAGLPPRKGLPEE